jgi:hypothetical protein
MSSEKEKITSFGFGQLRFGIAAVLLLAAGLKAYQLATSPLPLVVQGSVFTPLLEFLNNRRLLMFVVESEILFALFLCFGIGRQWTWLASLFCFSAFSIVSAMKGLSGEGSCGCFGVVTVNPWITTIFDVIIVILLAVFRERLTFEFTLSSRERQKFILVFVVWIILAIPTLLTMLSLKQVHAALGTEMTNANGTKKIILEPAKWIGKELPLIVRFMQPDDGEILKQGIWTIILIRTDCPKCRQLISELKKQHNQNTAFNAALIEIPSPSTEDLPQVSFPVFKLDDHNEWFVTTPCMIKTTDGICVSIDENP